MRFETIECAGAGGLTLTAEIAGASGSMPVLLAHGGGQTRRAWKRVTGDLAEAGFRTVAVDLRGHGDSEWSADGAYETQDFAADLMAVASAMERRPALVGASLGGMAGMLAEGDLAPGSFASVTLVDIAPRMEESGVRRIVGFMEEHIETGFASPEEASQIIAGYMPHRPKRSPGNGLRHYLREKEDGRFYWHWDPAFIRGNCTVGKSSSERHRDQFEALSSAAGNLALPVHLIRGGSSDLISEDAVAHFLELVPHAEFTDIAGATHMVVGDANDSFSAAIRDFLKRHHLTEEAGAGA